MALNMIESLLVILISFSHLPTFLVAFKYYSDSCVNETAKATIEEWIAGRNNDCPLRISRVAYGGCTYQGRPIWEFYAKRIGRIADAFDVCEPTDWNKGIVLADLKQLFQPVTGFRHTHSGEIETFGIYETLLSSRNLSTHMLESDNFSFRKLLRVLQLIKDYG